MYDTDKEEIVFKEEIEIEESRELNDLFKQEIKQEDAQESNEGTCKCLQCSKVFQTRYALAKHKAHVHGNGGDFPCELCGKRFVFSNSLKMHRLSHTGGNNIKCDECDKTFKNTACLSTHKKRAHATEKPFRCEVCPKSFATAFILKAHLRNHTVDTPYKCDQCHRAFNSPYALAKHKAQEHGNGGDFACEVCGKRFLFSNSLKVHQLSHTKEYNFKCDQCHRKFKMKKDLDSHKRCVHATGYKCQQCFKAFEEQSQLSIHIVQVHECGKAVEKYTHATGNFPDHNGKRLDRCDQSLKNGTEYAAHTKSDMCGEELKATTGNEDYNKEKTIKCDECYRVFQHTTYLIAHKKRKHKCDQSSEAFTEQIELSSQIVHGFSCKICGKRFTTPKKLKAHLTRHSNEKNLKCDECDKMFKNIGYLTAHKKRAHATERPFHCVKCPKSFATAVILNTHMGSHILDRSYECDQCSEAFNKSYALAKHKAQEHGDGGDFPCEVCGNKFLFSAALKKHQLRHTEEYNISCDQCDKKFKRTNDLYRHKRQAHFTEGTKSRTGNYRCQQCFEAFKKQSELTTHIIQEHENEDGFCCKKCGELFKTATNLEEHTTRHEKRNIKCDECGKTVKNISTHKKYAHATERSFRCEVCPKSFAAAIFLKGHSRSHNRERSYKCDHCDKTFKKRTEFAAHEKSDMMCKERYGTASEKNTKCDDCDKMFQNTSRLFDHKISAHATGGSSQREECSESSGTYSILETLLRNNIADTPYKCDQFSEGAFANRKAQGHVKGRSSSCVSEMFEVVVVKEEPVELYDLEANQVVSEMKTEVEKETGFDVKQEPEVFLI